MRTITLDEFLERKDFTDDELPAIWTNPDGVLMVTLYAPGDPEWEEHEIKFHKNLEEITTRYAEALKRMPKW